MANPDPSPATRFKADDPRRWRGGSPALPEGFRDACRMAAWEHLGVVVGFLSDPDTKPELKLKAWQALADRGFGLPKAQVDVTSDGEGMHRPVVIWATPPSGSIEEWVERHKPKDHNGHR